ncbi:MAG: Mur ligase domain-containing protein, partial [Bacteroidia bacterium]
MKVHFVAIGGSIMHSLAIALSEAGHQVSGSDDQIYDPARTKLAKHGILPEEEGWHPERIHAGLDAVILGMHAFEDNPELAKAQDLGLNIMSFPEFIYQQSLQKQRIVIGGSFGKTTITSMIMHVLDGVGKKFNYLVGASVPGFDNSVRLEEDAPIILLEGDEYLTSRIDPRPKFLLYQPHMILLSGISWDHINVFPTEEVYEQQFIKLLQSAPKAANIIYDKNDKRLNKLVEEHTDSDTHYLYPYKTPKYKV